MSKVKVKLKCFRGSNKPDDIVEYDFELANAMIARGSATLVESSNVVINDVKVAEEKPKVIPQNNQARRTPPKSTTGAKIEDEEL